MKIVLISTSTFPSDQGIRTISAVLKKAGHDVQLVFMALSEDYSRNYSAQELEQLAQICKGAGLIGVNSYASTAKRAARIISYLKRMGMPIVYGGVHPTISPDDCIKYSGIVMVGEGEEAVIDLVKAIEKKKPIDRIKNLWIRKKEKSGIDKIIKNPVRNLLDNIDSLPFPDYEIESHYILEKGRIRQFDERDLAGAIFFLTGRGCPYRCDYCSNSLFNRLYEGKREKIKLLVDAGCTDIIVGIQGGERTNAEVYHRMQTDEDILRTAGIINKYKDRLAVMYDVITCNPYEKPEDIIALIRLLQKIPKPYFLSVNNLVFFPGSQLYNRAKLDGTIKTEKEIRRAHVSTPI